ncbi:hypothetical protein FHT40_003535 [Mycolicibacterium sp. BK556]|uniref:hypothetical protein n=1 Tax=Mycobacteriaceae TaxID=1762 RepID=UPI0010608630|nr:MULTISPECIES: hypothetical protein [Mycobacteriaceae]MBB3603874.1 hypothetical protein [Mycolicibacterium sp. BK556]MBB3634069.1 hypothetical protein [Mycolicibacterium sp. BK607]MBB3751650.1 hypothetical protein [Mycolicibacterium sp. BK634]TDO12164.1 hypothetical protein EV580_3890 [Mycobacterium sp. BK086]
MQGRKLIRAVCLVCLAAGVAVGLTACGAGDKAPAPTSASLSPTSKATLPGPNNFSPSPIAPLNPTVNPGNDQTQHP